MNPDAIVSALAAVIIMLLVGFPIHEFLHAWTAYRLGDNTARWQGRLTPEPQRSARNAWSRPRKVSAASMWGAWPTPGSTSSRTLPPASR